MNTLAEQYEQLNAGTAHVLAPAREVVRIVGPHAATFLHSLVSQDVTSMAVGEHRASFLLQPTGKVIAHFRILRAPAPQDQELAFVLDFDEGSAASAVTQLQRFKIRVKAEILFDADERVSIIIGDPSEPRVDDSLYEPWRIEHGVARFGREIVSDETVPNELTGLREAVSFTKGCYLGQELVERIDSRGGKTPHRLHVLDLASTIVPTNGRGTLTLDGKEVGTLTSAIPHPATGLVLALGFVHRSVPNDAVLVVNSAAGSADASLRPFVQ